MEDNRDWFMSDIDGDGVEETVATAKPRRSLDGHLRRSDVEDSEPGRHRAPRLHGDLVKATEYLRSKGYKMPDKCPKCDGTGWANFAIGEECPECDGTGWVLDAEREVVLR